MNNAKVIRYEGCQNYTWAYFVDGSKDLINCRLKDVVKSNNTLLKVHKSHVVNIKYISLYHRSGYLILENGDKVPIARRRKLEVLSHIENWVQNSLQGSHN